MTPEQAKQLGEVHWMLGQVRGTDLPGIRRNTDRLAHIHAAVDQIAWGVLDAAQGARAMIARLHTDVRAIAAQVGAGSADKVEVDLEPPAGG